MIIKVFHNHEYLKKLRLNQKTNLSQVLTADFTKELKGLGKANNDDYKPKCELRF